MTSLATTYSALGDPKHGGALFTLPREVRDEIYRSVLRKKYNIYISRPESGDLFPTRGKHELAILQVSKAVNHEVSDILYAESVFRFSMDFGLHKVASMPAHLANRMTNTEIDFQGLSHYVYCSFPEFYDNINAICDAVIAGLASTEIRRNHLRIRFFECCPALMTNMSTHLSKTVNSFIGFRTVLIEIGSVCTTHLERERSPRIQKSFSVLKKEMTITMAKMILDLLTPALGPAETAVPGDVTCYILHPQNYRASSAR